MHRVKDIKVDPMWAFAKLNGCKCAIISAITSRTSSVTVNCHKSTVNHHWRLTVGVILCHCKCWLNCKLMKWRALRDVWACAAPTAGRRRRRCGVATPRVSRCATLADCTTNCTASTGLWPCVRTAFKLGSGSRNRRRRQRRPRHQRRPVAINRWPLRRRHRPASTSRSTASSTATNQKEVNSHSYINDYRYHRFQPLKLWIETLNWNFELKLWIETLTMNTDLILWVHFTTFDWLRSKSGQCWFHSLYGNSTNTKPRPNQDRQTDRHRWNINENECYCSWRRIRVAWHQCASITVTFLRRWLFDEFCRSAHPTSAWRRRCCRSRCRRCRKPLRCQGPQLCGVAAVAVAPLTRPHQTGKLHQRPLRQFHDTPRSLRQISIKLA